MKNWSIFAMLLSVGLLVGCPPAEDGADGENATDSASAADADGSDAADAADAEGAAVAEVEGTAVALEPGNTLIQFVGTHTDPEKPDPRTGTFEDFSGEATVDDGKLMSVNVDIQTASLTTEIEKLTGHLKSGDFFNVNEHPTAKFESTSIVDNGDGTVTITGDLTLLGQTHEISFPATVDASDGLQLDAAFSIDRTQFGMDYGTDNVMKEVEMTVKTPR